LSVATYVALLRGINVGGNRIIKMADLRETFVAAGARDVETYIQSGNVVFGHAARSATKLAADLEKQLASDAGFPVPVVLRTAAELAGVIAENPFAKADVDQLHVSFLASALPADALAAVDAKAFTPERFFTAAREVYMLLPGGMGRSKLVGAIMKVKAMAPATARNWRTVMTLSEMAGAR
jgi:uncharacterized protein (DUF1697 family)